MSGTGPGYGKIFSSFDKEFIVFINHDINVDWKTSDEYDKTGPADVQRHNEIMNYASRIEFIPSSRHDLDIRVNFKSMIGEAIARSFDHDYENAWKMLKDAEEYIRERNAEKSRYWYLSASGMTALSISVVGYIGWYFRHDLVPALGPTAFFLSLSGTAGAPGALFSVIMRLGKTKMNPDAGKNLHYWEGFYRVVAGCISALLRATAVKLELLIPGIFTNNSCSNGHGLRRFDCGGKRKVGTLADWQDGDR